MQPHEWANSITRSVDADVRTLEQAIEEYRALRELADSLRTRSQLESTANRMVDDIAVGLSSVSQSIERVRDEVMTYYRDLRTALTY